jgi:hypothetical protein
MAYTIGPVSSPKSDKMIVRGADLDIVQARFGNLDAQGKPRYNAEPIGREALEKAFRKGAELLSAAGSRSGRHRPAAGQRPGLIDRDPARSREIAEIELTGPCRAAESERARSVRWSSNTTTGC